MKKIIIFLLTGIPGILSAQHVLQSELNLPRPGDEIVKQQVQYKDPGRSGEHVIWNFSALESIHDEYSLVYSEPDLYNDSIYIMGRDTIEAANLNDYLFIGTEHNTMYYYRFTDSCLWTMGHENATTLLQYSNPLLTGVFPVHYQDNHTDNYTSKGLYSSTVPFETSGNVTLNADACGMMVLPSGDTIRQVMRTKTLRTFSEVLPTTSGDTVSLNTLMETYQWYSKGYRYPIFETVHTIFMEDSTEIDRFETAFFYPPQEHYYLDDDEDNLALLENESNEGNEGNDPWVGLSYNVFPNPVKTTPLEVEIYLPRPANVRLQLRSTMGLIALDENKGACPIGICHFQLNTVTLPVGNYVLDIWLDGHLVSEIIMKR